jgi:hypothetical protein
MKNTLYDALQEVMLQWKKDIDKLKTDETVLKKASEILPKEMLSVQIQEVWHEKFVTQTHLAQLQDALLRTDSIHTIK